jgi:alcohol dehydrogenase
LQISDWKITNKKRQKRVNRMEEWKFYMPTRIHIGNTSIHPLSYPITIDYGISHGFACAIFLPEVIRFNASAIKDSFRDLLTLLNLASVEAFADKVESLMEKLKAPRRLAMFGVRAEEIPGIAKRGIGRSTAWNPRPMTEEDIVQICKTIL